MSTRVSLIYAGWLPQDGTFDSELAAGLEIERNLLGHNGLLIELTRVTPGRLPTPVDASSGRLWALFSWS